MSAAGQDYREVMSGELRAMGMGKPLSERLPRLLERDENVTFLGICSPAGSWWREALDAQIFAATDRRLLLIPNKFLTAGDLMEEALAGAPTSIRFRDIRGLKVRLGLLESKLDIELEGDETVRLTSMRRKAAKAAAEAIQRHAPLRPLSL